MPRRAATDLTIPGHLWQRPSGKWSARYTDDDGGRHQRTFATKDEAITWLGEIDKRRRLGRYISPAALTVSDLVERWLEQEAAYQTHKPVTRHRHRRIYELHIRDQLGSLRVQEVDRARMRHWLLGLAGRYSASHINGCLAILNGAFGEAVELGIIDANPCARLKRPPEQRRTFQTWSLAHCTALWRVVADDPMWNAIYRLMLATGMRQGELRALVWSDLSFEHQRIHVRRTITLDDDGKVTVGSTTKTDRGRTIALAAGPLAALRQWREASVVRPLSPERNFIFWSIPGKPLAAVHWQNRHKAICQQAGIPVIRLHDLRHTFATLALEQGIPIQVVSNMLGHSRIETTMNRYQHITADLQRSAVDTLDALLSGDLNTGSGRPR